MKKLLFSALCALSIVSLHAMEPETSPQDTEPLRYFEKDFLAAASRGDVVAVKRLLDTAFADDSNLFEPSDSLRIDVNVRNEFGHTALDLAHRAGRYEVIRFLQTRGAVLSGTYQPRTQLYDNDELRTYGSNDTILMEFPTGKIDYEQAKCTFLPEPSEK
jgi:hypothetical protein